MAPPSGPGGNGNGSNGNGARIYHFPGPRSPGDPKDTSATTEAPQDKAPKSPSPPPEAPRAPLPRPSFHYFTDLSELLALMGGQSTKQSAGAFAKFQLYLEILANPKANGGYEASFERNNQVLRLTQDKPNDLIRVQFFEEPDPAKADRPSPEPKLKFQMTYYPDGQVGHAVKFDGEGKALNEKSIPEAKLRRAPLGDHTAALDFLRSRSNELAKALKAFQRMEAPLQQFRPSELDLARRATWYRNFAVVNGKAYSLLTQNIGFSALGKNPSQTIITIFEDQGQKNVELFRISRTGEINYSGEGTPRKLPKTIKLGIIDRISTELEKAQKDPKAYEKQLHENLKALEETRAVKIERPRIVRTSVELDPNLAMKGILGDPINIKTGRDLLRWVRPFVPQTQRWENPENLEEVRNLRPKGKIRWAMTKELSRWIGSSILHMAIHDWRNPKPQAGSLKLQLLPDGSADLEIYRNYERYLHDGTLKKERGIYNILRRTGDGKNFDLGNLVKQIAKERPDILDLSRAEQLKLASQTLTHDSDLPRSLEIQTVKEIPIDKLRVGELGPQTVQEAWEALHELPEVRGLKARILSEVTRDHVMDKVLAPENRVEIIFPGSQPPTQMLIQQEAHTTGKRLVVNLWQGDKVISTAVYDDGIFNEHESVRLNVTEAEQARQGFNRPPWYHIPTRGFARMRGHVEVGGFAYGVGHFASLPAAWAWERVFWTPGQRQAAGTPIPQLNLNSFVYETGAAAAMLGFAGGSAWVNDAIFNYGGGLWSTLKDWRKPGITFNEAYRHHQPTFFNSGWARFKPLPKQLFYVRAFAQRAVPLFFGLLAVEAYHKFGENWNLKDMKGIDWNHMGHVFGRIGAVSFGSAGLWALASRRTELAVARKAAGKGVRGLGGFLLRNKFLANPPIQVGGARFAMTLKASIWTVAAEMAILRIWDSMDRKDQLIDQGRELRTDLSRSLDRYNRVISRLDHGEEIAPAKIFEAESGIRMAHQRYRSYLTMMEKEDGHNTSKPLSLDNDFAKAYGEMERDSWILGGGPISSDSPIWSQSQWTHREKLSQLRRQDEHLEESLTELYRSHGIPVEVPGPQESLREFMARTIKIIQDHPEILDKALEAKEPVKTPVPLDSLDGRAMIDHLNRKIGQDPSFLKMEPRLQARYLLNTFSGYRVKLPEGGHRPWTEEEAMAFMGDLFAENQRRQEQLKTPLLKMAERDLPSPEVMEEIAVGEAKIWATANQNNAYVGRLSKQLAGNVTDLDIQMKDYLKRTTAKRDQALLHFVPEEATPPQQVSAGA